MNSFFNTIKTTLAVIVTALAYALAAPAAFAQTKTTCTNCSPTITGVTASVVSAFGGNATANFVGPNGFGRVNQQGSSNADVRINGSGNGCPNNSCGNTTYSVSGRAMQQTSSIGAAWTHVPGNSTVSTDSTGRSEAVMGVVVTPAGQ